MKTLISTIAIIISIVAVALIYVSPVLIILLAIKYLFF